MRGDQVVCRGYERVMVQPRAWVTQAVPLTAEMPTDGDNDGMPDAIDNCRQQRLRRLPGAAGA